MSRLIVPQWPLLKGVAAYNSTRIGGMSLPPYGSLDLGAHCGDNSDHVGKNRRRLFTADNLSSKPVWFEQIHGKGVLKLTDKPCASKQADASYSNTPDAIRTVMTADCLPVLLCNQIGAEVTAAHAGWHGLYAGMLEEMVSCFADNPEDILAWLGPAIGPHVLEVGVEVREAFMAIDAKVSVAFIQRGDKYLADVYQLARRHLTNVGVGQTLGGDRCTYAENETFFSYRHDKIAGRMANFIWSI